MTESQKLETPSGKVATGENFPVGSILLPARLRPHVAAFYELARAADDIADNARMGADEKLARLSRIEEAIEGGNANDAGLAKAHRMRDSLAATSMPPRHCLDLLHAFRQDAVKRRYVDWYDLIDYCNRSAAPVGRFLLDLHGEDRRLWPASDALCNALQVLNHLQDCAEDYRKLDRVYIPVTWLAEKGIDVGALAEPASSPGLRRVLDRMLSGVDVLLEEASPLARMMRSRRLAAETAVIQAIARRLAVELRRRDPLREHVKLSRKEYAACVLKGIYRGLMRRQRDVEGRGL